MAAPALPTEVQKLLVDQAPSARSRANYFDLSVFVARHGRPYSSRRIPIATLMEMRTDAIMRFAQIVALVSIFTSKWKIECANARKAAFVDNALRRIIGRLIIQYFESWNFGWQALVKEFGLMNPGWQYVDPATGESAPVWEEGGYPALVWEPFVMLRPQSVAPVWTAAGAFNGIAIAKSGVQGGYAVPMVPFADGDVIGVDHPADVSSYFTDDDQTRTKVDLEHSLWVTNERDAQFGSPWGYPRLGYCNTGEAPILMGDYSLKRIDQVAIGDEVVGWEKGFGRKASGDYAPRKCLTRATVTDLGHHEDDVIKVTFESGKVIRCTAEHFWLQYGRGDSNGEFAVAKVGRSLSRVLDVECVAGKPSAYDDLSEDQKVAANWLGGIYDGEGSGAVIGQSETHNPAVRERIAESLELLGFAYTLQPEAINLLGGREEVMRFARLARPTRTKALDRAALTHRFCRPDEIVSIEPDGRAEVYWMTTTTGNYVAWGLASKNSYKYWWAYEMTFGILQRAVERHGDPTIVVSYPQGESNVGGQAVSNQVIAFQIAEKARSGSVLAVPSEVWGDDMGTTNQAAKWKVDYLRPDADFDKLVRVLEYYDVMRFRSMMVSELAIAEGSGGTSSRNVAAETGQRTAESQIFAQAELDEAINRYMIPQLADANFPELRDEPARKVTQAFGQDEAQLAADLLRSYANSDADRLPIDKPSLLGRFQIDALEGEALDRWQQDLARRAEQSTPPPDPAKPGGAAGVTDTGFYYQAPEVVRLEEDEALLASLPGTKHYSDRAVLAQTRLVRRLWRTLLAEQYEDFARHVAKADLSLADDQAQGAAERVVAGWRFAGATAAKTVKAVAVALGKILARAGSLELSSSRIKTDAWDPGKDEDLAAWVRDNAAALVRDVDETTRAQLSTFLASELRAGRTGEEVATNLREHFAGFPDWRADLIAREETKRYYNAGTLFAAGAVGSSQVQALDAQGPGETDAECVRRNGRLFSVADAWRESAREHVRGTLSWRILPVGVELSFAVHSREESGEVAARIDQQERVIHLVEGMDPATEGRFLERAVEWYVASV